MSQTLLDFMRLLSAWLDGADHREGCGFGQVVQSGPLEGNKIHCSCGLVDLQRAAERVIEV